MANNPPLAAGIDLGSNIFCLLIARCHAGRREPLVKKLASGRLGRSLTEYNILQRKQILVSDSGLLEGIVRSGLSGKSTI